MQKERVGQVNYNKHGSKMTIIEYNGSNNVVVRFDDGHEIKTWYSCFKNGQVRNPYDKSVYGVGYYGEGEFVGGIGKVHTREYHDWQHMLGRCYSDKNLLARPSYKGCTVCEEWHNFQTFAQWHKDNFYQVDEEVMCLDKDILLKGNRIYSPETCIFVPKRISNIFESKVENTSTGIRGIYLDKRYNTYSASCGIGKDCKHIGTFKTKEEAFQAYKIFKEDFIKQVADTYKNKIPNRLYEALYTYEVEISDK